ncbi:MAG: nodulation protein NfeD [Chloroflexota bacterium]
MKKALYSLLTLFGFLLFAFLPAQAQNQAPLALVLTADGPITPALQEYLERGLEIAEQRQAEVLILQLNTPGGSVDLMSKMVQVIRSSQVPVVVYVSPRGAIAGSAGTVITLAGHLAIMAPETAIGAASPVGSQGEDIGETMEAKTKEIIKATIRSIAAGRSPEAILLAEDTVDNAKAASANEALEVGLVDFIATDLEDLLTKIDGLTVETTSGMRTLHTAKAQIDHLPLSFVEQLLQILTNPNIIFLLLTIGVQAVLIEISHPGGWAPGFIGAVCLALAIYGLGILPVNWFGLVFLAISFVLFILDIKAPTHGALTAAGIGSFILGALVLFNSPGTPEFWRVSVPLVVVTSLFTAAIFATILTFALRAQKAPLRTGGESLVGRAGFARSDILPHKGGMVQVAGELWSAELSEGEESIPKGMRVEVVSVLGVRVKVKRAS